MRWIKLYKKKTNQQNRTKKEKMSIKIKKKNVNNFVVVWILTC